MEFRKSEIADKSFILNSSPLTQFYKLILSLYVVVKKRDGFVLWKKIETLLKQKHISVYRLSKMTKISETTIQNYKNGSEPSFTNMDKIAKALDVSLEVFRSNHDPRT